jgi:class 3 adenylate cyclase
LDEKGELLAVFEIYESKVFLDKLLLNSLIPALALPSVLFCVLLVWLWRLMVRAQKDIDRRTSVLASLRQRLELFVSTHAVDAALDANDSGDVIAPERVATTLLYSDIRQFTSLAENNPPRKTIEFLNELMSIQVKEINRFDGDVDKMIGDAVNVSARLCSAAEGGQIVVDGRTVRQSDFDLEAFTKAEDITMKGREESMRIHRWTVDMTA